MAEINRVVMGRRTVTHIRGRVFRFAPKAKRKGMVKPANAERRVVCVLNSHDTALLEYWQTGQRCHGPLCRHEHLTRESVNALVLDGVLKFIPGSGRNVAGYIYGRTWKPAPSGPEREKVMQLV